MQYKFAENKSYEDFSSGRVLYHKTGNANFPARLASEIFSRCLSYLNGSAKRVSVYDPCCGAGYLLAVLGFLFNGRIASLSGSDADVEAVSLARKNLSLLAERGMSNRKEELKNFFEAYGKESHALAVESAENLSRLIKNEISCEVFQRDIIKNSNSDFKADVVITDVPYGNLIELPGGIPFDIEAMLENLFYNLNSESVVAVVSGNRQKFSNEKFIRLEKFIAGKRKIEILKLKPRG